MDVEFVHHALSGREGDATVVARPDPNGQWVMAPTTPATLRHPAALAWEAFSAANGQLFDGSADGRFLANRLERAFLKGWDAAEDAVREALAKPR